MLSLIITAICSTAVFTLYLHSLLCFSSSYTLSSISLILVLNPSSCWLTELILKYTTLSILFLRHIQLFTVIFKIKFDFCNYQKQGELLTIRMGSPQYLLITHHWCLLPCNDFRAMAGEVSMSAQKLFQICSLNSSAQLLFY